MCAFDRKFSPVVVLFHSRHLEFGMNAKWAMVAVGCIGFGTACGDFTTANGEFGRINYSLYTEYVSDQTNLTEASIVTGINNRFIRR